MTTNFEGRESTTTPTNGDAPLFAAQPVWERSRKKKGMFGAKRPAEPMAAAEPAIMANDRLAPDGLAPDRIAPETRSFAAEDTSIILDSPIDRPFAAGTGATMTHSTLAADEPLAAPIGRPAMARSVKARNAGPSAAVIAGAIAAVALVAVGGWYAMAPRDGVPELAPGQTTSEVAAAPIVTAEQPAEVAAATNTLPDRQLSAPVRSAPRQVAQAQAPARVRPAASAAETGTNASAAAVLPDAPQPYSTLNPSAAPAQVTPPPVEAAPAPVETAPPAAIPETPPVQAAPAPAPETTPPPVS